MSRHVSRRAATGAADRIASRRVSCADPQRAHLARMPEAGDLLGFVRYVRAYPAADLHDRLDDYADAFLIADHLYTELDRQRRLLYESGRRIGLTWGLLARVAGKPDRRYAEGEYRRLVASLDSDEGVKDEKVARSSHAAQRAEQERVRQHGNDVVELAVRLVALADVIPDDLDCGYGADELRAHLADCHRTQLGAPPAAMAAGLRLMLNALKGRALDARLRSVVDAGLPVVDAP